MYINGFQSPMFNKVVKQLYITHRFLQKLFTNIKKGYFPNNEYEKFTKLIYMIQKCAKFMTVYLYLGIFYFHYLLFIILINNKTEYI